MESDLLAKGPKYVVTSLVPDLYEMHEMYRKMERIIKGRWFAFCKIKKYHHNAKSQRLDDLNKILSSTITDNDDYDNPYVPPKFKAKKDDMPCSNNVIIEFLSAFKTFWFDKNNWLDIKRIIYSSKQILKRDSNESTQIFNHDELMRKKEYYGYNYILRENRILDYLANDPITVITKEDKGSLLCLLDLEIYQGHMDKALSVFNLKRLDPSVSISKLIGAHKLMVEWCRKWSSELGEWKSFFNHYVFDPLYRRKAASNYGLLKVHKSKHGILSEMPMRIITSIEQTP